MLVFNILILIAGCCAIALHARQVFNFARLYRKYKDLCEEPLPRNSFIEFLVFARAYYDYAPALEERVNGFEDKFLRDAVAAFLHGGVVGHDLLRTLRQRAEQKYESDLQVMRELQAAIRGLPAIGWVIAICAALWMFNSPEALSFHRATGAFSIAMAGVFYGLTLTYFVMVPLMEKVYRSAHSNRMKNAALVEGLGHLIRKKNVFELYETVQVLLPEQVRPKWAEVFPDKMKLAG